MMKLIIKRPLKYRENLPAGPTKVRPSLYSGQAVARAEGDPQLQGQQRRWKHQLPGSLSGQPCLRRGGLSELRRGPPPQPAASQRPLPRPVRPVSPVCPPRQRGQHRQRARGAGSDTPGPTAALRQHGVRRGAG